MGVTSAIGSFGIGIQSAKGVFIHPTSASNMHYIPALNVDLVPEQNTQTLPPEVGGAMWAKGAFKSGVLGTGGVSVNVRPLSIGWLFKAFAGTASSTTASGDRYKHTFYEHTTKSFLPYCSLTKNVADTWWELYGDARVDTMRLDFPTGGLITATFGFVAATYTGTDAENTITETFDTSSPFTTNVGSIAFNGDATKKVTRLSLDFSNGLSRDERVIGSYSLDDMTPLRRTCRISADTFLTTSAWYKNVYNNGSGNTWSPCPYSANLVLQMSSACDSKTAVLDIVIPEMIFMAYPVSLAGQDLIRVQLSAELIMDEGSWPFYIDLTNTQATYDTA